LEACQALAINKVETRLTACAVPAYAEAMQVEQPRATFSHANVLGGDTSGTNLVTTHYYWYDGNGNVTGLMRSNGTVDATHRYAAFGGNGATTTTAGTFGQRNPYRFSTKYLDNEVETVEGTYYYGYRHYAVALGRWLTRDPIKERGGVALLAYLSNRPVNTDDMLGLCEIDCKDPCNSKSMQNSLQNNKAGGGVVCCDGKAYTCSSGPGQNLDKNYPDSNSKKQAKKIIDDCAAQHEKDHKDQDVDCSGNAGKGPTPAPWKKGVDPQKAEGQAHSDELRCLAKHLPPEGKKGTDQCDEACQGFLGSRAQAIADNMQNPEHNYPFMPAKK
jgi:RHS repeat-associated protein